MAPAGRSRSLADQIAELEDPTPKDFDPEDIDRQGGQDESASDASDSENEGKGSEFTGREHYEQVGKSKLRGVDDLELGKEYKGKKVSRDALMDEGAHDPFAQKEGESESESESESEEGSGDEDEEMGEGESNDEEEEEEGSDEGLGSDLEGLQDDASSASGSEQDDEESESESEDGNDESATESSDDEPATPPSDPNDPRSEIRRLMSKDTQSVAASISAATKADAEKGRAVKRQRLGYDALVGTRMELQKGWVNMNVLMSKIGDEDETDGKDDEKKVLDDIDGEEIRKAETAALSLWSTIEGLRGALADAQRQDDKEGNAGEKRKRETPAAPTPDTPLSDIWDRMESLEEEVRPSRRSVLEKWALKTRGVRAAMPTGRGKLMQNGNTTDQQSLGTVLDAYVAAEQKQGTANDEQVKVAGLPLYDDTAFYQSLLRTLVEERMSATSSTASALHNMDNLAATAGDGSLPSQLSGLSILPKTNVAGMRKDKVKRAVDTKASKGRKLRYNVHEKLQNFMAPEDRGMWGEAAREEFFASLLGRSAAGVLGEGEDEEEEGEKEEEDQEEGGLRLFRS